MWYFGDTLVGERQPGESLWYPGGIQIGPEDMGGHHGIDLLLTNTGAVVPYQDASHGLHQYRYITTPEGALRQLVPRKPEENPDEIRVWCLHGIEVSGRLYLGYMLVRMLASGPMPVNFEIIGSGLAEGSSADWKFLRCGGPRGEIWWPADLPQFGSCFIDGRDGFVYIYGVLRDAHGVQRAYIARAQGDELGNLASYSFCRSDSEQWVSNVREATSIMTGMPNEMSVSWNRHLGCWLAVHSLDLTGAIVGRTARNPWGPWSDPVTLWQVQPPKRDYKVPYGNLIYAGKEHPELSPDGRVLYLTYVEFEEYYPHLVEVVIS